MVREKRAYPRVEKSIRVKLATNSFDIYAHTKNISCAGAYCEVNKLVPPMTKLDIMLFLPNANNLRSDKVKKLHLRGVVVRCEPNISDEKLLSTNIAIFFSGIRGSHKEAIAKFVNYHLNHS